MFTHIVPIGGYVWEDGSNVPVKSKMHEDGVLIFRYEYVSRHCKKHHKDQIPCNRKVQCFDNRMHDLETQLVEHSKRSNPMFRNIYMKSDEKDIKKEIKSFNKKCEKEKLFY